MAQPGCIADHTDGVVRRAIGSEKKSDRERDVREFAARKINVLARVPGNHTQVRVAYQESAT